jgi:hypothetical protein
VFPAVHINRFFNLKEIAMERTRNILDEHDYVQIANEWDSRTIEELAGELQVSTNTIRKVGATLRKKNESLCAKAKRRTREDIADEAIRILNEQAQ